MTDAPPASPAAAPPAPEPRPAEPRIICPPASGSGPMPAEPCMRDAWIGEGDFPPAALALGQQGTVEYRLLVGASGRVARCARGRAARCRSCA